MSISNLNPLKAEIIRYLLKMFSQNSLRLMCKTKIYYNLLIDICSCVKCTVYINRTKN